MMKQVKLRSPASIANLVCGFDIIGMSLKEPFDEMTISQTMEQGIVIEHQDSHGLSTEPSQNVAGVALLAMMEEVGEPTGFRICINKQIKPGSGLGSSAASAAGAVVGANALLNNRFTANDLVRFAMAGEKLASGVKHADNIAPCIFGGISLIRSIHPLDIISLDFPELFVAVVHPQVEVKTSDARQILRKQVLLKDAIKQWGNIAGLITGLLSKNVPLIGRSLEDVIIEPVRSILIPAFHEVKTLSMQKGSLGGGIAGSGPSIFMLAENEETATVIGKAMNDVYEKIGLECKTYVTGVNSKGIEIIKN
ncbi:MAG TPA: homoserine kinase [Flavitalea sp.]|nr:homoserine kinase [Flavitalea sp.]